jgi:hypothetical protein
MKRIYKYEIPISDELVNLEMPRNYEFLSVQNQNDKCVLWAEIDTEQRLSKETFWVVGTGHDMNKYYSASYLGTVQIRELVWHIYKID